MINESMPIVDARLENGSRVNAVIYPVALNGPILTCLLYTSLRENRNGSSTEIRRISNIRNRQMCIRDRIVINALKEREQFLGQKLMPIQSKMLSLIHI